MADPVLTAAIWQRYEHDRPGPGRELSVWIGRLSEEIGTPERIIRQIVAQGAGAMLNVLNERMQTHAQQIADMIGADLVAALDVLREGFSATRKKVLLDKSGRPRLIDEAADGPGYVPENMIYIEMPDWQSRLSAVRTAVEIHGARAPQQIEVDSRTVTIDLTPTAAIDELARLAEAIPRLQALAAASAGNSRNAGPGATVEVSVSRRRPALLADGMHGDAGRAG